MSDYSVIKNTNVITIAQGADYEDTVTVTHSDTGLAYDLTGATIRAQLRTLDGTIAATFTCTNLAPTTGVITMTLAKTLSRLITNYPTIQHVWGVEITTAGGVELPEINGGAMITPEVVI